MIANREIHAAIHQPNGMVHFLEQPERYDTHATLVAMESALQSAMHLAGTLNELHNSLATDQHYLARTAVQERQPQWDEEALLSK